MRGFECGVSHTCCDANVKRHSDQESASSTSKPANWRQKRLKDRLSQNENHGLLNHSPALSPANSSAQKPFLPFKQKGRKIPAPSSTNGPRIRQRLLAAVSARPRQSNRWHRA